MGAGYVVGAGMVRFGKHAERGIKSLAAEALELALRDAGVPRERLGSVWFANSAWGFHGGQDSIRGEVALRPAGVCEVPIVNVENACAGGATALHGALLSVTSGAADAALAIGVEKMHARSRLRTFAAFLGGLDVEALPALAEQGRALRAAHPPPAAPRAARPPSRRGQPLRDRLRSLLALPGLAADALAVADHYRLDVPALAAAALRDRGESAGGRSPFMDIYAIAARQHMERYGTTQAQLARIAAKNHAHGALNPLAQRRRPMSTDEVLADRALEFPLTRAMCAPIGDGAAAVLVCSGPFAKRLGLSSRAVRVRASVLRSGREASDGELGITARTARAAYEAAQLGPDAIDLAEVHDATSFGELRASEALAFCGEGEGGQFAESGATTLGGAMPLNTSGGLEARGHPIAASGIAQVCELVMQLRGEAGARQVERARVALAQNGGGMLQGEEAAMGVHVLEAPGRRRS